MIEASFGIVDAPGSFANAGTWPTWPEEDDEDEAVVAAVRLASSIDGIAEEVKMAVLDDADRVLE